MRKKKRKPFGRKVGKRSAIKALAFWRSTALSCIISWIVIGFWAALLVVTDQGEQNRYITEDTMLSLTHPAPLTLQLYLFGEGFQLDYTFLNETAKYLHQYFTLIPAPLRLLGQLSLSAQEQYALWEQQQRMQDFWNSI